MEIATKQTVGQLEREISQKVQAAYRHHLGHQPKKVSCRMFNSKVVIVLEDSITQPEKILAAAGEIVLAEQVRSNLNRALQSPIKTLVEKILAVDVLEILSNATIETGRTGVIAILSETPTVRNPEVLPKEQALEGRWP